MAPAAALGRADGRRGAAPAAGQRPRRSAGLCGLSGGRRSSLLLGLLARSGLSLAAGTLLGLALGALLGLAAHAELFLLLEVGGALGDDVGDRLDDQLAGLERVVVARHDDVDAVGVAVGVDEADDRDAKALGLLHGDGLSLEVDDEDGVRQAGERLGTTEVAAELGEVGLGGETLTRREQLELALGLVALEVVEALDAALDGAEVREEAAEPAVLHVRHAGASGVLLDGVLGLLLGADEEDLAAAVRERRGELLRVEQGLLGLQQIDDVDAVDLAVDETAHLRVPTAGLVAEVDTGLEQVLEVDSAHAVYGPFAQPSVVWACVGFVMNRGRPPWREPEQSGRTALRVVGSPGREQVQGGSLDDLRRFARCG